MSKASEWADAMKRGERPVPIQCRSADGKIVADLGWWSAGGKALPSLCLRRRDLLDEDSVILARFIFDVFGGAS